MTARRRFTGEFKAKVALEALRGDKTIQEIAVRHKVHPNQVGAWKQRAVEGMKEVFTKGAERMRGDQFTHLNVSRSEGAGETAEAGQSSECRGGGGVDAGMEAAAQASVGC